MTFELFWFDFYWEDKMFGFGFCLFKNVEKEMFRGLFTVHWSSCFSLDLFWINIMGR